MNRARPQDRTSRDDALMVEMVRVSNLLGRYVVAVNVDGRAEPSIDDETALAEQVASVADGLRARARRRAAGLPAEVAPRQQRTSAAASGKRRRSTDEVAVVRWPFLARLVDLPGPSWHVGETRKGAVTCSRTCDGEYTETVSVIGVDHARLTRTPIPHGSRRAADHLDVTGTFGAIVEVLQHPVEWEDEP